MATKKKSTKKKQDEVTYKGRTYKVLERDEHKTKLTDGLIHFWVRNEDVEAD